MAIGGGKAGGGASAAAIRAGQAVVEIFGKDRLSPVLDSLKNKFNSFGGFLTKAGGAGLAAGTAVLAPITGLFTAAVDRGKDLQLLADRMGTTVEAVSSLAYAFETIGVQTDQFGDAVKGLQQKLSQAADGQDETFRRLGLNARELMNLPLDEQFGRIADALSNVSAPADQARFAMEALGEVGLKLLPALKNGAFDLAALRKEAGEVGATMSGADAKRATEIAKSTAKAWSAIKYAVMEVGMALLPQSGEVKRFAGWVAEAARTTRQWVADNKALVLAVVGVGAGLAVGGAALVAFGLAAKVAGVALGVVAGAIAAVKVAVLALLSPVGLVAAAVGGIAAVFLTQTEAGQKFVADTKAGFLDFAATAREAWDGIGAAMARGDLGAAARVGLAFVGLEWAKAVAWWTDIWNKFKGVVVDGWRLMRDAIGLSLAWIGEQIGVVPEGTVRTLAEMHDEQKAEARKARAADLAEARRRVAEAQAGFKRDVAQAMQPAPGKPGGVEVSPELKRMQAEMSRVFDAIKGGFGGQLAAQRFGYGDKIAQRQLAANEKTAKAAEATVKAVKEVGDDIMRLFRIN